VAVVPYLTNTSGDNTIRESDLTSPGIGAKGHHLRRIAANAISQLEVAGSYYGNGRHPDATALEAFFQECVDAAHDLIPAVSVPTFTPTSKSYSLAAGATAGPVLAAGGHTGVPVYTSASPLVATVDEDTGEVTAVAGSGTSVITATFPANGGYALTTKTYVATATA
jgi:uncharacterized protein YjdB